MTCCPAIPHEINITSARAALARKSLAEFVKQSWHVIEPQTPLLWNWHLDAICEHIQAVLMGWLDRTNDERAMELDPTVVPRKQVIQNLLCTVPPGAMKSRIVSVCAPAWMWLHCPSWRAIFISANPRVVLRDAVYCRELISSDWYRNTFRPDWEMAEDQNAKGNYKNTAGGFRMAIGAGSKITGDRGDALIVDDPHDADEVKSDAMRNAVLEWWDSAAWNRVNDLRTSVRIGIMQRLHDEDWAGHVLKQGGWEHLCIKQEYEPGKRKQRPIEVKGERKLVWFDEPTAIGWKDPRTVEGDLMFPIRFPREIIDQAKRTIEATGGSYSGQHQQDPMAAGGNIFKQEWFQYFTVDDDKYILHARAGERIVEKRKCKRITIGDFAFSTKQTADYTVLGTADITPTGDILVIDIVRFRREDPDVEAAVEREWDTKRPIYIGIENKQNGATILQRLSRKGRVRTKSIEADTDKLTRSLAAQTEMKNGKFFFAQGAEWLLEYEAELKRFPTGAHDDQVDVTSYLAIEKPSLMVRLNDWGTVSTA